KRLNKLKGSKSPIPQKDRFVADDELFARQAEIIRHLADTESCVIVGKCADYILKDYDNVISLYIEAPRHYCVKRIMDRMDVSEPQAHQLISRTDRYRAEYYEYYTQGNYWTNPVNYDMTFNMERVGEEKCIRIIKNYLSLKMGSQV
ncbi:MAG: cytidylate kinase-like family protein, partial [Eubacteriales bacterium]|nr:cytidylate kinase-like family protein [Eubacteriales bacterium]